MVKVSSRLRLALLQYRANGGRQYGIARQIGIDPSTLSSLVNDIQPLGESGRKKLIEVGKLLDVPEADCFEPVAQKGTTR